MSAAVDLASLRLSEREVLAVLRGRGPVAPVEIERALPHRDARTIRSARARLLELGLVVVSGTPSRPRVALAERAGSGRDLDPDATRAGSGCNPGPDPGPRAASLNVVLRSLLEETAAAAALGGSGSGSGWVLEAVAAISRAIDVLARLVSVASSPSLPARSVPPDRIPPSSTPAGLERERHACATVQRDAKPGNDVADALEERQREHSALVAAGRAKEPASPGGWRAHIVRALEANPEELASVLERRRVRLAREAAVAKASQRLTVSREARADVRQVEHEEQRQAVELRRAIESLPAEEREALRARAETVARAKGKRPGLLWEAAVRLEEERAFAVGIAT